MVIVAIDPGERHTGVAWLEGDKFDSATWHPNNFLPELERILGNGGKMVLVVEEFRLYPWKSNAQRFSRMVTCEVIGVIKYLAKKYKVRLVMQKPSFVKAFATDNKLKKVGWYTGSGHAKDAARHLYYYLEFKKWG